MIPIPNIKLNSLSGGELLANVSSRQNYSEEDVSKIIRQILEALKYLHAKGIAHRDLKVQFMMQVLITRCNL